MLYTDGIVEAANVAGEEFGQERLGAVLWRAGGCRQRAVDHAISKIQAWSKMQSDDLTVLICDYLGAGAGSSGS